MRLSFERLWIWIAIVMPALVALLVPLPAVDLAYQVRAGNDILAAGALPRVDTWTFTVAGTPWLDQQWLAQVVLALVHRLGGWELLVVLRAVLVAVLTGGMVAVAMARGAGPRTAAILSLLAFALAAQALALRPQLFGLVIFVALLWLVAVRERHPRAYLAAPLLVALWANLHGSFVMGPALLGYAWLDDRASDRPATRSLLVLVLGLAGTLLNPFGAGAWTYAVGIGVNPAITSQVGEWQRTSPLRMPGVLFYPSVIAVVALLVRGRTRISWATWLLVAALVAIGTWTERGVAWWALAVPFVVGGALRVEARRAPLTRGSLANGIIVAILEVLIVVALPWWRPTDPLTGRAGLLTYAPTGIAAHLPEIAGSGARVVAPQTWASWLEWAAPDARYYIDSRFELFPPHVWNDYAAVSSCSPDADPALAQWGAQVVICPATFPITMSSGWVIRYQDADGSILTRAGS